MSVFSELGVFSNPEINTYLDRMYYYIAENEGMTIEEAMEAVPLTGSVAAIIAEKILPRIVKDIDFVLENLRVKSFLIDHSIEVFGITEEDVIQSEDRLTIVTPYVNLEMFFTPRRGLEPMQVGRFFLII